MMTPTLGFFALSRFPSRICARISESVKCRFSKCRFRAEVEKLQKSKPEMGGSVEKQVKRKASDLYFRPAAVRESMPLQ